MKAIDDLKIFSKLAMAFGIIVLFLTGIAVLGLYNNQKFSTSIDHVYQVQLTSIKELENIDARLNKILAIQYQYILYPGKRTALANDIKGAVEGIDLSFSQYKQNAVNSGKSEQEFETIWKECQTAIQRLLSAPPNAILSQNDNVNISRESLEMVLADMLEQNQDEADAEYLELIQTTGRTQIIIFTLTGLALILALTLTFLISNSISKPLKLMVNSLTLLSRGDQNRNSTNRVSDAMMARKDEIGAISRAFVGTSDYLIEMVEIAGKIAEGDLSLKITPHSEKDELGIALQGMTANLHISLSHIDKNANLLTTASQQLASSANEAGQATSQISGTIQQVAVGITQQSASVNNTAGSVDQMNQAIGSVARGVQEQAAAMDKAANITAVLSTAIEQVTGNVNTVVQQSTAAADAARKGTEKVQDTLTGMQIIKTRVGVSAEKVQDMSRQSNQIGSIVTAIEDIASQTNLLALNAAIEAARAGEAGKGFAVVADEVRKLAERTSSATKEIGGLIKSIQKIIAEAVTAMDEGTKEVDRGVVIANESGLALSEILKAAEAVTVQAGEAAAAAGQMTASANEMVAAVDSVSRVVEENTSATEQMSAGSSEVTQSIENIASVSEQNSASVEEVSASAEEMTAQVNEVTASARALAEMAQSLSQVVAQFKLQ